MKRFFLFFTLFVSLASSSLMANIVIDDFSAAQSVEINSTSIINDSGILGGERSVETSTYATVAINTSASNQAVLNSTPNVSYYAYVKFRYDGIGSDKYGLSNLDLTSGGKYSGFQISITDIGDSGGIFYIIVGQNNKASSISILLTQTGTIYIPFTDFEVAPSTLPISEVDFTDTGYIELSTWVKSNEITVIDSFEIVPEPAAILLLSLGGLMIRRK